MYKYTIHPYIAHPSKELAFEYYSSPLVYHKITDGVVISCSEPFLNSFGLWQTNAVIEHN